MYLDRERTFNLIILSKIVTSFEIIRGKIGKECNEGGLYPSECIEEGLRHFDYYYFYYVNLSYKRRILEGVSYCWVGVWGWYTCKYTFYSKIDSFELISCAWMVIIWFTSDECVIWGN